MVSNTTSGRTDPRFCSHGTSRPDQGALRTGRLRTRHIGFDIVADHEDSLGLKPQVFDRRRKAEYEHLIPVACSSATTNGAASRETPSGAIQ
jgi:hypothetical protein